MSVLLKKVGTVNYKLATVPEDYQCDSCDAKNVKLWRLFQREVSRTKLLCARCAERDQKSCHKQGWRSQFSKNVGEAIGWYVPAVPLEGRNTYWAYPSVPEPAMNWWLRLPIKN